jgi:hypothetical protein
MRTANYTELKNNGSRYIDAVLEDSVVNKERYSYNAS